MRTLLFSIASHGESFTKDCWKEIMSQVIVPIFMDVQEYASKYEENDEKVSNTSTVNGRTKEILLHHTRNTSSKQWSETRTLLIQGIGRIFNDFNNIIIKEVSLN